MSISKIEREVPHSAKARDPSTTASKVEGEGSYAASKDYKESIDDFLDRKGRDVEKLARKAAADLDKDKTGDLRKAEDEGRSHAKK